MSFSWPPRRSAPIATGSRPCLCDLAHAGRYLNRHRGGRRRKPIDLRHSCHTCLRLFGCRCQQILQRQAERVGGRFSAVLDEADEVVVQVVPPAAVGQALLLAHDMARGADEEVRRCRSVREVQGESLDGGRRQP